MISSRFFFNSCIATFNTLFSTLGLLEMGAGFVGKMMRWYWLMGDGFMDAAAGAVEKDGRLMFLVCWSEPCRALPDKRVKDIMIQRLYEGMKLDEGGQER